MTDKLRPPTARIEDAWDNSGEEETCLTCDGTGREYGETCVTCGGLGFTCWPQEDDDQND